MQNLQGLKDPARWLTLCSLGSASVDVVHRTLACLLFGYLQEIGNICID